jgi:hypothetical protein
MVDQGRQKNINVRALAYWDNCKKKNNACDPAEPDNRFVNDNPKTVNALFAAVA